MADPSQVILLVEDKSHKQFALRYLKKRGIENRHVRVVLSPSGKGSAENWVRHAPTSLANLFRTQFSALPLPDGDDSTLMAQIAIPQFVR